MSTDGIAHAQQTYKETLALQGVAHPDTQDALSELARQRRLAGDLPSARSIQERVVQTRAELWGEGDYGTFRARHLLASFIADLGDLDEAKRMQEEILLEALRYFGDDPEVELPAVLNLANTLYKLGDLERAAELYERSTSLSSTVNGTTDQATLQVMAGWILSLRGLGRTEQAKAVERDRTRRQSRGIVQEIQSKLGRQKRRPK